MIIIQKSNIEKITDDQTPEVFASKKDQKGLSEELLTKYFPDTVMILLDFRCGPNKQIPPRKGDFEVSKARTVVNLTKRVG